MDIRTARRGDLEAVAEIHARCWREVYAFMPAEVLDGRDREHRLNQWTEWYGAGRCAGLFVVEASGAVVGFCYARPNSDPEIDARGEMHAAYVMPEWRGGAVGPMMMRRLTEHLAGLALTPMCLWAFKAHPVWRWYMMLGWRRVVERDRIIGGQALPEYGFTHGDPDQLLWRCDLMLERAQAGERQSQSPSPAALRRRPH
jgi:GNAT superfamily N-acetyltransferase